ncbi:hypothetical protein BWQ96_09975 [Gracilariopsis chorda]|uniref:KIF-binding protein n=1 Tax=Gracilariopsis chorda TaxID=448386 RepID=A0A2V3IE01_9FLOR|nr:hypothetical protein BWQ96_09975 [Gracilariopsis chorda]|eukprot:PXF40319.1 hypothetical protein BWQ96_09975 [Gracilariopsis chorda]
MSTGQNHQLFCTSALMAMSTHPLHFEKALAALESALRRGIPPNQLSGFHPLEQLGDLYLSRPTGHRVDNLDRALLSYTLASRTAACALNAQADLCRARLSAKLAQSWFVRLQTVSGTPQSDVAGISAERAHLRAAADAIDIALQRYEDCAQNTHPSSLVGYRRALLFKGLIYDTLCRCLDAQLAFTAEIAVDDNVDATRTVAEAKRAVWKRMYNNSCIQALEKLFVDTADRCDEQGKENCTNNVNSGEMEANTQRQGDQLPGVTKVRGILCLARAYVGSANTGSKQVSAALNLLRDVDTMLDNVIVPVYYDGFRVDEEDLKRMKEEARCLEALLAANDRPAAEGRCVVC